MYYSVKRRQWGSVYICLCCLEQLYPEETDLTWTMESFTLHRQHLGQSQGSAHTGRVQDSICTTFQLPDHISLLFKVDSPFPFALSSVCVSGKVLVRAWEYNVLFSQRKPQLNRRMQISAQLPQTASGGALMKTEGEKCNNNKGIMAHSATLWPGHTAGNTAFSPRVEMQFRGYH